MNNSENEMLNQVVKISHTILNCLRNHADLGFIFEKVVERNDLAVELIEKADIDAKRQIVKRLLIIRDEEEALLIPYREELEVVRQSLVSINHSQQYSQN